MWRKGHKQASNIICWQMDSFNFAERYDSRSGRRAVTRNASEEQVSTVSSHRSKNSSELGSWSEQLFTSCVTAFVAKADRSSSSSRLPDTPASSNRSSSNIDRENHVPVEAVGPKGVQYLLVWFPNKWPILQQVVPVLCKIHIIPAKHIIENVFIWLVKVTSHFKSRQFAMPSLSTQTFHWTRILTTHGWKTTRNISKHQISCWVVLVPLSLYARMHCVHLCSRGLEGCINSVKNHQKRTLQSKKKEKASTKGFLGYPIDMRESIGISGHQYWIW